MKPEDAILHHEELRDNKKRTFQKEYALKHCIGKKLLAAKLYLFSDIA